ncbi:toxin biosynthesis protein [Apiospora arundinis]|uniref:Pyridoxal phosphate-dependent transferase n=1 Tax=Apiospora arundinis TaxID=335852 RepID=A0ABR2IT87_9PEZI
MALTGTDIVHILLPVVQITSLALPPFQHRALIFVPLIAALAYASATNLGAYSAELRATLISLWPWYLGTIADLAWARPEHDYWRLDRPAHEAESMSGGWGWRKLAWSAALWANPRGIGWSHQIRGVRRGRGPAARWPFVWYQLRRYVAYYLIVDVMGMYTMRHFYHTDVDLGTITVRAASWTRSFYNSWHLLLQVIAQLQFQYISCSMVTVALGIYEPKDWPPWLGTWQDLRSVRLLWNAWEHQIIRRVFSAYARVVVTFLGLRRGTNLDHYSRVYVSFFISGIFHGVTNVVMPGSPSETFGLQFVFYILQAFAIQAEDLVAWIYQQLPRTDKNRKEHKAVPGVGDQQKETQDTAAVPSFVSESSSRVRFTWQRAVGHLWQEQSIRRGFVLL